MHRRQQPPAPISSASPAERRHPDGIEDTLGRMEPEFRGKLNMIIAMLGRLTPPTGESA